MSKAPGERDIYLETKEEWDMVRPREKAGAEEKGGGPWLACE